MNNNNTENFYAPVTDESIGCMVELIKGVTVKVDTVDYFSSTGQILINADSEVSFSIDSGLEVPHWLA